MKAIWLAEPDFLLNYLDKIENATAEDHAKANAEYGVEVETEEEMPEIMEVNEDTAIIKISGVLTREGPTRLDKYFGFEGTGYTDILESLRLVRENDSIKNVVLKMDTPGGQATGLDEIFQEIFDLRGKKNIIAENHGMIASAGYWIAAACKKIRAMAPSAETGSIGVIIVGLDFSEAGKKIGIKKVRIVSKNAPNKQPDIGTKKGRDVLQERVDALERIFIARVAEGRDVPMETVIEDFGQGGLMVAIDPDENKPDALAVGMIDSALTSVDKKLANNGGKNGVVFAVDHKVTLKRQFTADLNSSTTHKEEPASAGQKENKEVVMKLAEFLAENPAAKAEHDQAIAIAKADGRKEGRDEIEARIKKATPFLGGESKYPAAIQNLAARVISGESEPAALEGAVAVFDAQAETNNSNTAAGATNGGGENNGGEETPPAQPAAGAGSETEGHIKTEDDYQAAVKTHRHNAGMEG